MREARAMEVGLPGPWCVPAHRGHSACLSRLERDAAPGTPGTHRDGIAAPLGLVAPGKGDVIRDPLAGPEGAVQGHSGAYSAVDFPVRVHDNGLGQGQHWNTEGSRYCGPGHHAEQATWREERRGRNAHSGAESPDDALNSGLKCCVGPSLSASEGGTGQ